MLAVEGVYTALPGSKPIGSIDYSSGNEPNFQTPRGKVIDLDGNILKGGL